MRSFGSHNILVCKSCYGAIAFHSGLSYMVHFVWFSSFLPIMILLLSPLFLIYRFPPVFLSTTLFACLPHLPPLRSLMILSRLKTPLHFSGFDSYLFTLGYKHWIVRGQDPHVSEKDLTNWQMWLHEFTMMCLGKDIISRLDIWPSVNARQSLTSYSRCSFLLGVKVIKF